MRNFFLMTMVALGLTGLSGQAQTYGLCNDECCDPCNCSPFNGWYIGGNIGWAFHDKIWVDRDGWVDNFSQDWALGSVNTTNDGFTGGIQGGYNWLCGCSLLGLELDFNWADLHSNKHYSPTATEVTRLTLKDRLNWYGTIRGRAGIIANCLLLYGTVGAAYANIDHRWRVVDTNNLTQEQFKEEKVRWGLALGLGAERAITCSISVRAEVLYLKFPETRKSGFSPGGIQVVHFDLQNDVWVARVGANFSLNGCWNWF
jgi:outer membrane immunogenic protein